MQPSSIKFNMTMSKVNSPSKDAKKEQTGVINKKLRKNLNRKGAKKYLISELWMNGIR